MEGRLVRLLTLFLGISLLVTSVTLAYMRRVDADTYTNYLQASQNDALTARIQLDKTRQALVEVNAKLQDAEEQLAARLAELAAKTKELEDKKTELTKATADLDKTKKDLSRIESLRKQESQELENLRKRPPLFSFRVDSSTLTNVEQKKEDVKSVVTAAYDVIRDVYGDPFLLNAVTISFVDSFSNPNAAAEIVISNSADGLSITIRLKDFDKNDFNDVNSVIHEIVHAYHGLSTLSPVAYEEGITVAASDVVMEKLIASGKISSFHPLYIRILSNDYASSALTIPRSTASFYASSDVAHYYQLIGYGWYQIYKADTNFFKKFNEKLYAKKRDGQEITESLAKSLIKESFSGSVQGKSIDGWLETKAFNLI